MNASPPSGGSRELRKRRILGAVLLTIAVLALVHRYVPFNLNHLVLPVIGVAFIVWSAVGRVYGLLIPGCIISGVGFGQWLQRSGSYGVYSGHGQALFLYALAAGFVLIILLSAALFRRRVLWPLFPACFIAVTGMVRDGVDWLGYIRAIQPYWPFALLGVAIWLLVTRPRGGEKS